MNSAELLRVNSFEARQVVETNAVVVSHNDKLLAVLRELERSHNGSNLDVVSQNDRVRAVDHYAVAILAHHSKHGLIKVLNVAAIQTLSEVFAVLALAFSRGVAVEVVFLVDL